MTPTATAERRFDADIEKGVQVDPMQVMIFRMLDDAFGRGWQVLEDIRIQADLGYTPIDIVVPLEEQEQAIEKAIAIQAEISRRFKSLVYLNVTSPSPEEAEETDDEKP